MWDVGCGMWDVRSLEYRIQNTEGSYLLLENPTVFAEPVGVWSSKVAGGAGHRALWSLEAIRQLKIND